MQIKDLVSRPHVSGRLAVTVETPFHRQAGFAPRQRHLIHLAMTGHATDPLVDVNAVVEVNEVRQAIDADPRNRFVLAKAGAHGFKNRRIGPDLRMTIHTRLRGRHSRERTDLYGNMAKTTIDS